MGDGLKLLELGDGGATLTALAILLAKDNGRGLGDLNVTMPDTPLEKWKRTNTAEASPKPACASCRLLG
jgi:hypothetical protein